MSTYNLLANNYACCKDKKSIATIFLVSDVKLLGLFWHLRSFSIICCESSNNEWSGIIRFHLITYLGVHYALLKYFRYLIREYANIHYSTLMYIRTTNILFFIFVTRHLEAIFLADNYITIYDILVTNYQQENF